MIRWLGSVPELDISSSFAFPPMPRSAPKDIVAAGGNLSPGLLLSAYRQGIFPWYGEDEPILWWSPDPRFIVLPELLHISATSAKLLRKARFALSLDRDFRGVIESCANVERPGQDGTWIMPEMIEAYCALHREGYAHSVEVSENGELVGGLYGVSLGAAFFGESMFSARSGASRAAFLSLAMYLFESGFEFIDSQIYTDYVAGMGGASISRQEYLKRLAKALAPPDRRGNWGSLFPDFPRSAAMDGVLRTKAVEWPRAGS